MSLPRWTIWMSFAAGAIFNNWILGIIFNHHLFLAGGSVSEFSALTQPYSWLFRSLDIISGVLLAVTGAAFWRFGPKKRFWPFLAVAIMVLGLANCLDAILPLPCSGTLNAACSAPVRINFQRVSFPDHVISSTIIGIFYVILPALGWLYAKVISNRRLTYVSFLSLVTTLLFFALLLAESIRENPVTDHLVGYSQELQMLVLAWWLVEFALHRWPHDPNEVT